MRQVLSGIKVVELAEGVAGSYCGKLFADLGADVVKVESPSGDELRHRESVSRDADGTYRGGAFLHLNTNKRSTVLDPAMVNSRERLGALIDRSDLIIEATGLGRLETWGYAWNAVHARAPGASVVRISGFGATGPYAGYQWDDLIVQAVSNNMIHDRTNEAPVRFPGQLGLCIVANLAALGALGSRAERRVHRRWIFRRLLGHRSPGHHSGPGDHTSLVSLSQWRARTQPLCQCA